MAFEEYVSRIDRAWQELREVAPAAAARKGLSDPDPSSDERWDTGQLLAHIAEMLPYWLGRIRSLIVAGGGQPFGRTTADPDRIGAIERDRGERVPVLLDRIEVGVSDMRDFLTSLNDEVLDIRGVHPTLGEMDMKKIIEHFVVSHLEDHAEQLRSMA